MENDSNNIRILLVEDDEDDYLITRDLLKEIYSNKLHLTWVQNYKSGLDSICNGSFDICLIDYRLGEHTGIDLLYEVNEKECADLPIILLTGQGDTTIDIQAMKAGAMDYLVKGSIDAQTLERAIRYAIERKRSEIEIKSLNSDLENRVLQRTSQLDLVNKDLEKEIGERKKTEEALRTSEARTRMVLDATLGGRELRNNSYLNNVQNTYIENVPVLQSISGAWKKGKLFEIFKEIKNQFSKDINKNYEGAMNYASIDNFTIKVLWGHFFLFSILAVLNSYFRLSEKVVSPFATTVIPIRTAWISIGIAALSTAIPLYMKGKISNHYHWRILITICLTIYFYLFVMISGGAIEMHFHIFIVMSYLAIYADWRLGWIVLLLAAFQHFVLGNINSRWVYYYGENYVSDLLHGMFIASTASFLTVLSQYHRHTINALESARGVLVSDLIERKRAEKALTKRDRQQVAIANIGQKALSGEDLGELISETVKTVTNTLRLKYGAIFRLSEYGNELSMSASKGFDKDVFANYKVSCDKSSQAGYTILSSKPVVSENLNYEKRFKTSELKRSVGLTSSLSVVIHGPERPYGVLEVFTKKQRIFSQDDINFLQSIANILSIAIERRENEEELTRSEERYRLILENIQDYAIFTMNLDGYITNWNIGAERIFGYHSNEIQGQHITSLTINNEDSQTDTEKSLHYALENSKCEDEGWRVRKNGRKFWVHSTTTVLRDSDGRFKGFLNVTRDLTERKKAEEELRKREERFRSLVENGADGIIVTDLNGRVVYTGPNTEQILGYKEDEFLGVNTFDLIHPEDKNRIFEAMSSMLEAPSRIKRAEMRFLHKNGSWRWIEGVGRNLLHVPSIRGIVTNFRDITERRLTDERIYNLAYFDQLTRLPNRALFKERLSEALFQAQRSKNSLAVLFIDLDKIKNVNDSLGHNIGDILLQEVAKRLIGCISKKDTACRQGGDEFIILLPKVNDVAEVEIVAKRLIEEISKPFKIENYEIDITPSIGISLYPQDADNDEHLIMYADAAMYISKNNGGNSFRFYSADVHRAMLNKITLQKNLRNVLKYKKNELSMYHQPKVNIHTGNITGTESLIRWNDPNTGMIPPSDFIPIAEETNLIIPLGDWILKHACMNNKILQEKGFVNLSVAVNISARQFNIDIVKKVNDVLKETKLNPECLEIEITESTIMQESESIIEILQSLKKLGVKIAIDDFGTGYSSLSYLKRLPIDYLKIDRSFISNIPDDPNDVAIVTAIISMAHSLGLKVVAEGVENERQIEFLKYLGCDEVQGYYYSSPIPVEAFIEYYSEKPGTN